MLPDVPFAGAEPSNPSGESRAMIFITSDNRSAPAHDTHKHIQKHKHTNTHTLSHTHIHTHTHRVDTSRVRRDAGGPSGPSHPGLTPNHIGGLGGLATQQGARAPL